MISSIYFIVISIISIILTCADKRKAIQGKWRVRESTLFLLAALGGSAAMFITMNIIHHKTKHMRFMIGLPIIFILQLVLIYVYFFVLKLSLI